MHCGAVFGSRHFLLTLLFMPQHRHPPPDLAMQPPSPLCFSHAPNSLDRPDHGLYLWQWADKAQQLIVTGTTRLRIRWLLSQSVTHHVWFFKITTVDVKFVSRDKFYNGGLSQCYRDSITVLTCSFSEYFSTRLWCCEVYIIYLLSIITSLMHSSWPLSVHIQRVFDCANTTPVISHTSSACYTMVMSCWIFMCFSQFRKTNTFSFLALSSITAYSWQISCKKRRG